MKKYKVVGLPKMHQGGNIPWHSHPHEESMESTRTQYSGTDEAYAQMEDEIKKQKEREKKNQEFLQVWNVMSYDQRVDWVNKKNAKFKEQGVTWRYKIPERSEAEWNILDDIQDNEALEISDDIIEQINNPQETLYNGQTAEEVFMNSPTKGNKHRLQTKSLYGSLTRTPEWQMDEYKQRNDGSNYLYREGQGKDDNRELEELRQRYFNIEAQMQMNFGDRKGDPTRALHWANKDGKIYRRQIAALKADIQEYYLRKRQQYGMPKSAYSIGNTQVYESVPNTDPQNKIYDDETGEWTGEYRPNMVPKLDEFGNPITERKITKLLKRRIPITENTLFEIEQINELGYVPRKYIPEYPDTVNYPDKKNQKLQQKLSDEAEQLFLNATDAGYLPNSLVPIMGKIEDLKDFIKVTKGDFKDYEKDLKKYNKQQIDDAAYIGVDYWEGELFGKKFKLGSSPEHYRALRKKISENPTDQHLMKIYKTYFQDQDPNNVKFTEEERNSMIAQGWADGSMDAIKQVAFAVAAGGLAAPYVVSALTTIMNNPLVQAAMTGYFAYTAPQMVDDFQKNLRKLVEETDPGTMDRLLGMPGVSLDALFALMGVKSAASIVKGANKARKLLTGAVKTEEELIKLYRDAFKPNLTPKQIKQRMKNNPQFRAEQERINNMSLKELQAKGIDEGIVYTENGSAILQSKAPIYFQYTKQGSSPYKILDKSGKVISNVSGEGNVIIGFGEIEKTAGEIPKVIKPNTFVTRQIKLPGGRTIQVGVYNYDRALTAMGEAAVARGADAAATATEEAVYEIGKANEVGLSKFGEATVMAFPESIMIDAKGLEILREKMNIDVLVANGQTIVLNQKALPQGSSKVPESFKSEIDWAKWNKDIPNNKPLMEEYRAIEHNTKQDGTWMKNPDGTPFDGTKEQFVQQQSENFKKAFPEGVDQVYRGVRKNRNIPKQGLFTAENRELAEGYAPYNSKMTLGPDFPESTGGIQELYFPKQPRSAEIDIRLQEWAEIDLNNIKSDKDWKQFLEINIKGQEEQAALRDKQMKALRKKIREEGLEHDAKDKNGWTLRALADSMRASNAKARYWKKQQNMPAPEVNEVVEELRKAFPDETSTDDILKYMLENDIGTVKLRNIKDDGFGTEVLINNAPEPGRNVKSAFGNDGMFDMTNPDIYKSVLPLVGTVGAAAVAASDEDPDASMMAALPLMIFGRGKKINLKRAYKNIRKFFKTVPALKNVLFKQSELESYVLKNLPAKITKELGPNLTFEKLVEVKPEVVKNAVVDYVAETLPSSADLDPATTMSYDKGYVTESFMKEDYGKNPLKSKKVGTTFKELAPNGPISRIAKDGMVSTEEALAIINKGSMPHLKVPRIKAELEKRYGEDIPEKISLDELNDIANLVTVPLNITVSGQITKENGIVYDKVDSGFTGSYGNSTYGHRRIGFDKAPLNSEILNAFKGLNAEEATVKFNQINAEYAKKVKSDKDKYAALEKEQDAQAKVIRDTRDIVDKKMVWIDYHMTKEDWYAQASQNKQRMNEVKAYSEAVKNHNLANKKYEKLAMQMRNLEKRSDYEKRQHDELANTLDDFVKGIIPDFTVNNRTLIFSNNARLPGYGVTKHDMPEGTMGHVHITEKNSDEETLVVTQIQSDAAQRSTLKEFSKKGIEKLYVDQEWNDMNTAIRDKIDEIQYYNPKVGKPERDRMRLIWENVHKGITNGNSYDTHAKEIAELERYLGESLFATESKSMGRTKVNDTLLADRLGPDDNTLKDAKAYQKDSRIRMIEETIHWAAQNGYTKVRFPAPQTVVNVQEYQDSYLHYPTPKEGLGNNIANVRETNFIEATLVNYLDISKTKAAFNTEADDKDIIPTVLTDEDKITLLYQMHLTDIHDGSRDVAEPIVDIVDNAALAKKIVESGKPLWEYVQKTDSSGKPIKGKELKSDFYNEDQIKAIKKLLQRGERQLKHALESQVNGTDPFRNLDKFNMLPDDKYKIVIQYQKDYEELQKRFPNVKFLTEKPIVGRDGNYWYEFVIPKEILDGVRPIISHKKGGVVEAELTKEEVQKYIDQGYVLDELT